MSARELSDECDRLGHRVEYQVIANMETGRRTNVSVAEIFILGAALKVPPFHLITPVGDHHDIELLPGEFTDPWDAFAVSSGMSLDLGNPAFQVKIHAYERHDQAIRRYLHLRREGSSTDDALEVVLSVRAEIRGAGWRLPRVPPSSMATTDEATELRKKVAAAESERGIESFETDR